MARSYKKTPFNKDNGPFAKFSRKKANKKVRQSKGISNGGHYKRFYDAWAVCDYREYVPYSKCENDKQWRQIINK